MSDGWVYVVACSVVVVVLLVLCWATQPWGLGADIRHGCALAGYDVAVVTWEGTVYCAYQADLVPYWEGVE